MPKTVKYSELKRLLKSDINYKKYFFQKLEDIKWFKPLYEDNLLSLSDEASPFVIDYLIYCLKTLEYKTVDNYIYSKILVLAKNFSEEFEKIDDKSKPYLIRNFEDLLLSLDLKDFEQLAKNSRININKLFAGENIKHSLFFEKLLKKILNCNEQTPFLLKTSLEKIFEFDIKEHSIQPVFYFSKIYDFFSDEDTKNKMFSKLDYNTQIFIDILETNYKKLEDNQKSYDITQSDFERRCIEDNPDLIPAQRFEKKFDWILVNLIRDCSIKVPDDKRNEITNLLLSSNYEIIQRIGLYTEAIFIKKAILIQNGSTTTKTEDLFSQSFLQFWENLINREIEDFDGFIYHSSYEIYSLFESLAEKIYIFNSLLNETQGKIIEPFFHKFNDLKSIKRYEKILAFFERENEKYYNALGKISEYKEKLKSPIREKKEFFEKRIASCGWVSFESPKSKNELYKMFKEEKLISYLNSEIKYKGTLWNKNKEGTIYEENEEGLARELTILIKEHPEAFIENLQHLKKINKFAFQSAIIKGFDEKLKENKDNFDNKFIKILEYIKDLIFTNKNEFSENNEFRRFLVISNDILEFFINKKIPTIYYEEIIDFVLQNAVEEKEDYFDPLNTISGKYLESLILYILDFQKLPENEYLLEFINKKDYESQKDYEFLFHLGKYFDYFDNNILINSKFSISREEYLNKINNLEKKSLSYFLTGYSYICSFIETFKALKLPLLKIISKEVELKEVPFGKSEELRQRIIKLFSEIKIKFDENELFDEMDQILQTSNNFVEDYTSIINHLFSKRDNPDEKTKKNIISFWKDYILEKNNYNELKIKSLKIISNHFNIEDFKAYDCKNIIIQILDNCQSSNRKEEHTLIDLAEFLKNNIKDLKDETFEILNKIIEKIEILEEYSIWYYLPKIVLDVIKIYNEEFNDAGKANILACNIIEKNRMATRQIAEYHCNFLT